MANPSTATPPPASAVVDEAVRIAAEGSRRTAETAQATVQAGRRYLDQTSQLNRDLVALWSATAEAGLQTAFDVQNAAVASGQAWLDASATFTKDAYTRFADVTRQAQATTLKTYRGLTAE
jgi:hypothetical protein